MHHWLIATNDGNTHDLYYWQGQALPFQLLINNKTISERFINVHAVKSMLEELGLTVTEFMQVAGPFPFPIEPCAPVHNH